MKARPEVTDHYNQKRKEIISPLREKVREGAILGQFQQEIAAQDFFHILKDNQELRDIVEKLQSELNVICSQKNRTENELKTVMETRDQHERLIESLKTKRYEATLYTEKIKTENKSYNEQIYSLENENLLLLEKIKELESNEEVLFDEIEHLSNARCTLELSASAKVQEVEELKTLLENKNDMYCCIETENKLLNSKISDLDCSICEFKTTLSSMKIQHAKEIQQFQNEIEAEQRKSALLERETALSYAKKVQNAQNLEIERLTNDKMKTETHVRALEAKNYLLEKELEKAQFSLEQAESEVENLKAAVKDLKSTADNDKSTKSMRELMSDKEENMDHRCKVLEERLEKVSRELQSSEERNSRYEEGHGLSEAIIHQKRLEADIRRREVDLKKLLIEIGEKDDKIRLLSKTCEILREQHSGDCSETIDIDTDVISKIIEEEQTALHRQNLELRHQVDELEKERNCLMRRLRENALLVGGNGLCLHGLSSEKIDLVIDFVNNLRNGRVKLPLDDKSSKLASELSSLQTIRLSDVYTIKRLERELEAMRIAQGQSAEDFFHSRYFVYLKTAVEDIQAQNKELKFEMTQLRKPKQVCIREEDYIDGVDLVPSTRKKVEVMIGRELDKNLDVCTLLNLVYDAYETVRKKFENYVMLLKTKEVIIGDYRKEINDLQSRLTNIKSATKETRPIHVQVNIDQIELKMIQFALKASERNLVSCGKRVTRLQKQLEWRDQINGDQSRMMIAHTVVKELKACLATKNLLLAKYRTKSIHHKTTESDVKALPASSSVPRFCQAKSTFEETPTLSTLLTKITRFAEVIREKDSIIGKLKETISNLNVKEKARECYELSVKDKVSNLMEEKERMLCHSQLKYEQMVKEKQKLENLLGDAQQRFNIKQREYDSLSETVSRLKKGLKSKSEEIDRLSATESELRRIKMSLSLERRVKEKLNKVVQESKAKLLKANDDAEKLQAEVLELRKSLNDVRGAKLVLEKKYCRANVKIKEMKIIIDEKCNGEDKKLHQNNKVSQKSMNNSLQKENSRHRKIIASCKMKAKLGQNGRSSSADSMECCKGNKGITKKTSCSVNTIENEMVECMKEEIRKLNDSIAMNKERIEKSEIDIHEIVDQCSTDKTLNPKQDVVFLERGGNISNVKNCTKHLESRCQTREDQEDVMLLKFKCSTLESKPHLVHNDHTNIRQEKESTELIQRRESNTTGTRIIPENLEDLKNSSVMKWEKQ